MICKDRRGLCGKKERKVFARPLRSICFRGVDVSCGCVWDLGVKVGVGFVHAEIEDLHKSVTTRSSEESVMSKRLQAVCKVVVCRVSIRCFIGMPRTNVM